MSQAPLNLVRQREGPASGRQKVVTLTVKGEAHLAAMIERGAAYVQMIVDGLTDEQVVNGIDFCQRITAIVDSWAEQAAASGSHRVGGEHE